MKKLMYLAMLSASISAITACTSGSGYEDMFQNHIDTGGASGSTTTGQQASIGDLTSFDVTVNRAALAEYENVPTGDEDYLEYADNDFSSTVTIAYDGDNATVSTADGVNITKSGGHVTVNSTAKGIKYIVSGTTSNGSLKLYSDKKYELVLNGADITNPDSSAINLQSKKRAYIVLADGTVNKLTDGTSYKNTGSEDMKGTLFAEGKLLFSGSGSLEVYANAKNGIASDDYILIRPNTNIYVKATASNGIKSNDGIAIRGGVVNIEVSGTAAKGIKTDTEVAITGGRTTIIATGGGEYDTEDQESKACAGIKDSTFTMAGGQLFIKSTGAGGKGISSNLYTGIADGEIYIITTGKQYSSNRDTSSPKGIKCDGDINIDGGSVMVRATGGEGSEGIESKKALTVNSGAVQVYAYDDAINAGKNITINGGNVFTYASNNDGIDSNGTLAINGGIVIANGTTQPEEGFDCDNNTFTVTGGTLIGIGGTSSTPSSSTCKQPVVLTSGSSLAANTCITLYDSNGSSIITYKVPRAYQQYTLLLSAAGMKQGSSYTLATGTSVNGGTEFNGYFYGSGLDVSGGTTAASLTLSSVVTSGGNTGNMGGNAWGRPF